MEPFIRISMDVDVSTVLLVFVQRNTESWEKFRGHEIFQYCGSHFSLLCIFVHPWLSKVNSDGYQHWNEHFTFSLFK